MGHTDCTHVPPDKMHQEALSLFHVIATKMCIHNQSHVKTAYIQTEGHPTK